MGRFTDWVARGGVTRLLLVRLAGVWLVILLAFGIAALIYQRSRPPLVISPYDGESWLDLAFRRGYTLLEVTPELPGRTPPAVRRAYTATVAIALPQPDGTISLQSGFIYRPGLIATAAHFFYGEVPQPVYVCCRGRAARGELTAIDYDHDVMFLKTDCDLAPARLDLAPLADVNESVFALGFNFEFIDLPRIAAIRYLRPASPVPGADVDDPERPFPVPQALVALSGLLVKGNSGSPVVRRDGRVVGLVSLIDPPHGRTLIVTARALAASGQRAGLPPLLLPGESP